ncbi:Uncharacterised protein [Tsukamurella paurometabola]|uniref:Uncharacterized protein n=1 Tax=Tsukamurella paurometabola TaxID=2061 RepID=A0A3P8LCS2_TSUPA|nr:Uncharacterised protein [Tsukamurella paurometabola]
MVVALMHASRPRTTGRPLAGSHEHDLPELEPSEFSWGPGLTPPELADAPPSQGGMYRGTTPPMPESEDLRALTDELAERRARRERLQGGRQ